MCSARSSRTWPSSPDSTVRCPRNPFDSFTANFCHPNALIAMLWAQLLDQLSPNIQVAAGVHNVEGQYIKAAKNMSSVFAGFC